MPQSASPVVRTQKIIVNPSSRSVSVINAGSRGPAGVQGPQGIQGPVGPTGPGATDPVVYTRLDAVESKNTTQDTRLTSSESSNTNQDNRLTSVENVDTTQNNRLTSIENAAVGVVLGGVPVGSTNWTYIASAVIKSGNVLVWRLRVTRANLALNIDGKGSFLAETIGTLPVEWRSLVGGAFVASGAHLNGRMGAGDVVSNTGVVRLTGVGGTVAIAIGESIALGGVYIL